MSHILTSQNPLALLLALATLTLAANGLRLAAIWLKQVSGWDSARSVFADDIFLNFSAALMFSALTVVAAL